MEALAEGLNKISKSEHYLHSLKHPQLLAKHSRDLVFDHNFCLLYKKYESLILLQLNNEAHNHHHMMQQQKAVVSTTGATDYSVSSRESPNEVINRFKEVIRAQDETIEKQKKELAEMNALCSEFRVGATLTFLKPSFLITFD